MVIFRFASDGFHFTTDPEMIDERFMALAEGLTSLRMLEMLTLRGFRCQVSLF
jgi:hypothetical protein